MAYGNYPVGYQPAYYYPQQQYNPLPQQQQQTQASPAQQTQSNSSIIWVQGEAGAKSYLVAPNTTVQLWDSENQVIYLKSADASGMPSMKILDYRIREAVQPAQPKVVNTPSPNPDYVTRDELMEFEHQIREQIESLTPASKTRTTRKEDKSDG